jgi:hypothetical protein
MSSNLKVPSLVSVPDPEDKERIAENVMTVPEAETAERDRVRIAIKTIAGVVLESKKQIAPVIRVANVHATRPVLFQVPPDMRPITLQITERIFEVVIQAVTQAIPTIKTDHLHKQKIVNGFVSMVSSFINRTQMAQRTDVDVAIQDIVVIVTFGIVDYTLYRLALMDETAMKLLKSTVYQIARNDITVDEAIAIATAQDEIFTAQTLLTEVVTIAKNAPKPVIEAVDKAKAATAVLDRVRSMMITGKHHEKVQIIDEAIIAIDAANKAAIQAWRATGEGSWKMAITNSHDASRAAVRTKEALAQRLAEQAERKDVFRQNQETCQGIAGGLRDLHLKATLNPSPATVKTFLSTLGNSLLAIATLSLDRQGFSWNSMIIEQELATSLAEVVRTWNEAYTNILTAASKERATGTQMKESKP